jgi:hypothetical protein
MITAQYCYFRDKSALLWCLNCWLVTQETLTLVTVFIGILNAIKLKNAFLD